MGKKNLAHYKAEKKKLKILPMKTLKIWPQKFLMAVCLFFSAAPTAQNGPRFEIHIENVSQVVLVSRHQSLKILRIGGAGK